MLIIIYSGIFSAEKQNHPIPSIHTRLTGQPTMSTGMSRAFSEIVRGHILKAKEYNPYCIRIFLFFAIQFLLRITITIALNLKLLKYNTIRVADISLSILLFLVCFKDFILNYG